MKKLLFSFLFLSSLMLSGQVDNGDKAPEFTLTDIEGNKVSLSDYSGKTVILEWINPGCPFVRKFYTNGDMPKFQKAAAEMGAVWLAINSTSEGHRDYLEPKVSKAWARQHGFAATWLMDADGTVGKAYGARTTPHMYIINGDGKVVYQGAIDSIRDADPENIPAARNYVMEALEAMDAGEEIPESQTRPYGCSVKY
jgi:peroxiredoxin